MKKYRPKTQLGKRLQGDKRHRIIIYAVAGLVINLMYAFYNGILGIMFRSIWFMTLFAYYAVLSSMRFGAVMFERRIAADGGKAGNSESTDSDAEIFVMRFCGALLILLALILSGSVYISMSRNIAVRHQEIVMITIAAYTFYKVTIAAVNSVKIRKERSPLLSTIRNIGSADAAVSLLSLQRSMIASFGSGEADELYIMNVITGAAVFLFITALGIRMIFKKSERNDENGEIKISES